MTDCIESWLTSSRKLYFRSLLPDMRAGWGPNDGPVSAAVYALKVSLARLVFIPDIIMIIITTIRKVLLHIARFEYHVLLHVNKVTSFVISAAFYEYSGNLYPKYRLVLS